MANWREMLIWAVIVGLGVWGVAQRATPVSAEDPVEIEVLEGDGPVQGEITQNLSPEAIPAEGVEANGLLLSIAQSGPSEEVEPGSTVTVSVSLHNSGEAPLTLRRRICLMESATSPYSRRASSEPPTLRHEEDLEVAVAPGATVIHEITLEAPANQRRLFHVWLVDPQAPSAAPLALNSFITGAQAES